MATVECLEACLRTRVQDDDLVRITLRTLDADFLAEGRASWVGSGSSQAFRVLPSVHSENTPVVIMVHHVDMILSVQKARRSHARRSSGVRWRTLLVPWFGFEPSGLAPKRPRKRLPFILHVPLPDPIHLAFKWESGHQSLVRTPRDNITIRPPFKFRDAATATPSAAGGPSPDQLIRRDDPTGESSVLAPALSGARTHSAAVFDTHADALRPSPRNPPVKSGAPCSPQFGARDRGNSNEPPDAALASDRSRIRRTSPPPTSSVPFQHYIEQACKPRAHQRRSRQRLRVVADIWRRNSVVTRRPTKHQTRAASDPPKLVNIATQTPNEVETQLVKRTRRWQRLVLCDEPLSEGAGPPTLSPNAMCPSCESPIRMAQHHDWQVCGRCSFRRRKPRPLLSRSPWTTATQCSLANTPEINHTTKLFEPMTDVYSNTPPLSGPQPSIRAVGGCSEARRPVSSIYHVAYLPSSNPRSEIRFSRRSEPPPSPNNFNWSWVSGWTVWSSAGQVVSLAASPPQPPCTANFMQFSQGAATMTTEPPSQGSEGTDSEVPCPLLQRLLQEGRVGCELPTYNTMCACNMRTAQAEEEEASQRLDLLREELQARKSVFQAHKTESSALRDSLPAGRPPLNFISRALHDYDFQLVPGAYGIPALFRRGRGHHPSSFNSSQDPKASLAPIVASTMSYDRLLHYYPDLTPTIDLLRHEHAFKTLIRDDKWIARDPKKLARGTSRHMLRHLFSLEKEWQVVRRPTAEERPTTLAVMNMFTVPKKSGQLRLIMDARKLNDMLLKPPRMPLPRLHDVIDYLLAAKWMWTCDAKSYYYNFALGKAVQRYFTANFAGARGCFVNVWLTRMAMGFSWAPYIAQTVSNALLRDPKSQLPTGLAWVDNFLFAGTRNEVTNSGKQFLRRVGDIGIPVDQTRVVPTQHAEVLGMEFDLEKGRYRMQHDFIDAIPSVSSITTRRQLFQLTGALVWASYAMQQPLCEHSDAINILRRACHGEKTEWDAPFSLQRRESDQLESWRKAVAANDWKAKRPAKHAEIDAWTDASDNFCAFLVKKGEELLSVSAGPPLNPKDHIFLKEAYAIHSLMAHVSEQKKRGEFKIARDEELVVNVNCDNKGLVHAMDRQLSSVDLLNQWMSQWHRSGIRIRPKWVPTDQQLADPLTRGTSPRDFIEHRLHLAENLRRWRATRGPTTHTGVQQQNPTN